MLSITAEGAPPPVPDRMNLAAHVLAGAARWPDRVALQLLRPQGAERWSYARLEAAVRGVGTGLLRAGLSPGDRILMRVGNAVEFPLVFLGAIAAGIVPVPTAAGLTEGEVARLIPVIAPRLIVAGAGLALPAAPPCPVLCADRIAAMAELPPCDWAMGPADRLAYAVFTSGTSGRPLAVAHAHRAILARAMMRDGWEGLVVGDRMLHAGALNWTYTLGAGLMDPWVAGATALVPVAGVEVGQLVLLARRFDATILAAAPGVFRQMLRAGMPPLPRLRHGLAAGESLSPALRDAWRAATGTDLHEALGMSECSTFISGSPARPAPEGTAGYAQPGRRVAVLSPEGVPVARGMGGMLGVDRGDPGMFMGYLGDDATGAARTGGDWFLTGDMVSMGADGAITYLGRADDMLNAGGFRVSPLEIEAAFGAMPGLGDCAAVEQEVRPGVRVIALAYAGPSPIGEAALAAFAETRLARYKQPRLFLYLSALPRTANGKLNRKAVRAMIAESPPRT